VTRALRHWEGLLPPRPRARDGRSHQRGPIRRFALAGLVFVVGGFGVTTPRAIAIRGHRLRFAAASALLCWVNPRRSARTSCCRMRSTEVLRPLVLLWREGEAADARRRLASEIRSSPTVSRAVFGVFPCRRSTRRKLRHRDGCQWSRGDAILMRWGWPARCACRNSWRILGSPLDRSCRRFVQRPFRWAEFTDPTWRLSQWGRSTHVHIKARPES
jgi:hypothetical protein